ncbi:MAG: hypothetical protein E4G94_00845 [ANME-2 cluster archaeon]|nr:MAG: hypothetical protein E4G94_00845 [ANME-2 cluster archaeon]
MHISFNLNCVPSRCGNIAKIFMNNFRSSRKYMVFRLILMLIVGVAITLASTEVGAAAVITVDDNGGADYERIQDAVNNANTGDTILVRDGIYSENIIVNKYLTIKSENGTVKTTVQSTNLGNPVFDIASDYVNISGFTIKDANPIPPSNPLSAPLPIGGISLKASHCNVSNNELLNNDYGILLKSANNNVIRRNIQINSNKDLIKVINSVNNNLKDNIGMITIDDSSDNLISYNKGDVNFYYSNYNFISNIEGKILLFDSENNNFTFNTISNIYFLDSTLGAPQSINNIFYLNNITEIIIYGNGPNIWSSQEKMEYTYNGEMFSDYLGNKWSDYSGSDVDGNGIGDIPYNVGSSSNTDNYPLMKSWENYGFGDATPPSSFTVGQNAPTPAIEQLFKDAYNRSGGVVELGDPATEVHDAWGYWVQDFPGVPGIPGGVLMYNSIKNDVFYIHGAIWEKYYNYPNKAELGPVASDEDDAAPSQLGTTGRYSKFETGTIHWISDDNVDHPQKGQSFVTYGDLDALYTSMGGTYNNWLGFPVVDQEVRDGNGYCKFEGGHIFWDKLTSQYKEATKLVAIVPAKFSDTSSAPLISDLQTRANLVREYFIKQSYEKEYIGFVFPEIISNPDNGWTILPHTSSEFENADWPNTLTFWDEAFLQAGISHTIHYDSTNYPIGLTIPDYDAGVVVYPIHFTSQAKEKYVAVKADGPYGIWAHELGHSLYGLKDMAGYEKTGGNIGSWGLMGLGVHFNPPTPIIGFNKIQEKTNWLSYKNIGYSDILESSKEYPIYNLDDDTLIQENGLLRYRSDPAVSKVDYYIFEGRHERDGLDHLLDSSGNPYELFPRSKEGISIYHIENGNIYREPISFLDFSPHEALTSSMRKYEVSLSTGYVKYIIPENLKFTPFIDNNQLKVRIEHIITKDMITWEIKIPDISDFTFIGGNGGVPEESNLDVDIHVITSDGRKVGMDYTNGNYLNEIEGAYSSGNIAGGGYEWIAIPANIDAEAHIELTPELIDLITNDNTINIKVVSTFTTFDEDGNRRESAPIPLVINSGNVDQLVISLPINITFLPPITTMDQFNLTDGSTLPIKFTARNSTTDEFIYDDTVNVTITNSTGHLITYFTNGTGADSVRINTEEEQYIANFGTRNYDLTVGEIYAVTVTFGEMDSLRGYEITYFTLMEGGKAKGKDS